ncbi:MAG: flavodoxin-dependent (E)-4-hydroxy-3-methylbut-2-enyl-diphosphate synthase [Firmicutes bacterium]|nr:flavodoxin-dependent (E)-4-hydroxy-3-methylbut-2-enyl-diphosphate synthase [Bacillota bacterium]
MRRNTRRVMAGDLPIGGNAPISVQSMTNTDTRDIPTTIRQIKQLSEAGCELIRLAVVDQEAALALGKIKAQTKIPIVADIHFDHRLALAAVEQGVDKLRINPGNIGSHAKVKEVVAAARDHGIPIRIGVNSGSLAKWTVDKYGNTAKAMVESALEHVAILEALNFNDIIISLKATSVELTLESYKMIADIVDYPLHLGITEAGTPFFGAIKSAVGLGAILSLGIGDTIRVSLTSDPVEEVRVGWAILKSLGLRQRGPVFISCPTCGRTQIPLEKIAIEVEQKLSNLTKPLTVAIMGCVVNGPGEAKEADIGIAGGDGVGLVFSKGKIIRRVKEDELVDALVTEALKLEKEDD